METEGKQKQMLVKTRGGYIDDGNNEILLKVHHNIKCQELRDVIHLILTACSTE